MTPQLLDEVEVQWAPTDDPVFLRAPAAFQDQAQVLYATFGSPPVSSNNFWQVYIDLLNAFRHVNRNPELDNLLSLPIDLGIDNVPLMAGLQDLPHGDQDLGQLGYIYMGGLNEPPSYSPDSKDGTLGEAKEAEETDLREYVVFSEPDVTSESE